MQGCGLKVDGFEVYLRLRVERRITCTFTKGNSFDQTSQRFREVCLESNGGGGGAENVVEPLHVRVQS